MKARALWLVGGAQEARYDGRIARYLEKHHQVKTTFLTPFAPSRDALVEQGASCLSLGDLWERYRSTFPQEPQALWAKANGLLAQIDLNMLIRADGLLSFSVQPEIARSFIAQVVCAYHCFFEEETFDFCLRYGGGNSSFWAGFIMAEAKGIQGYVLTNGTLFNNCTLKRAGLEEQWDWPAFHEKWQASQSTPPSDEEREDLLEIFAHYQQSHAKSPRTKLEKEAKPPSKKRWKSWKKALRHALGFQKKVSMPEVDESQLLLHGDQSQLVPIYERLVDQSRHAWKVSYEHFRYDELPQEPFIYLPLNLDLDAPQCAWNPMNGLSENVVTYALESLPTNHRLLIKEHPYSYGNPSHSTLRRFQKRGVLIVDPQVHSHELIRKAAAICCVGDTTGWEGILFKTPVVIYCSRPFYRIFPGVETVTDPNQLHHALRRAVQSQANFAADEDLWFAFLQAAFRSCHPGNIWGYKGLVWLEKDGTDDNIKKIGEMIAYEVGVSSQ